MIGAIDIIKIEKHLFDREYMGRIERCAVRVKENRELFTPKKIVDEIIYMLDQSDPSLFRDPGKTFLDPTCGDSEFLAGALFGKLKNGIPFEQALSGVYGVDIMLDNVLECRRRLLCGRENQVAVSIVENNIRRKDALKYNFKFDNQISSEEYKMAPSLL